jgi:hypothetical protein
MIVGGLLEGLGHRLTGRGTADNGEAAVGCFALELGTQHGDTSIPVSWPSINILFSHIFSYPLVIFSTRYFRHNSGHQLTFPGFKHSLCALSQRRFGLSHFHVKRSKFTLAMPCASVFCLFLHQSLFLPLIPYVNLQSFPLLDLFIRSFCAFSSSLS